MKTTIQTLVKNINKVPERVGVAVAVTAAVVGFAGSATVLAYGPERAATYTVEKPADHVVFNSITNNKSQGDERNFVQVKDAANTNDGGWTDTVDVQDGKEYWVRMYVHNNAAENLNLVAKDVRAMASVPTTTGTSVKIDGYISYKENANAPVSKIWDDVVLRSDKKFNIAYVAGSARYNNNVNPNPGFTLPDSIVTNTGAQLGYQTMNGDIPGCFKYSGIVNFKVKVQGEKAPNFNVDKVVRIHGTSEWASSVAAKPGDKVDYSIGYNNTGQTQQNNVVVKDKLPANVAYDMGTTSIKNASHKDGVKVSDNVVAPQGINIGNYAAGANAYTSFTATLPSADKLNCGPNTLTNTATVDTDNGSKSATATVTINVECAASECKPGVPTGDSRCTEKCQPVAGQVVDANGNCIETPTALPTTGPKEIILSLIGVAALAAGIVYWYKSRKDLKKLLEGVDAEDTTAHKAPKLLKARTDTHKEDDKKDF